MDITSNAVVDFHSRFDQSLSLIFKHENIWVHVIGHVVLVVMPVALIFILFRWLHLILQWIVRSKPARFGKTTRNTLVFQIPPSLMEFIILYSGRSQIFMALLALSILPVAYAQLELPKRIINSAISAESLDTSQWLFNHNIEQVDYLLILCALFLTALLASACMKYALNISMGRTSERLLRHIRLLVVKNRTNLKRASRRSTLIPVVTQEVEPVCSFSSDALIVPLLHGGTVATIITFMMVQNVVLGAAAITMLPIQIIVIPRIQRRINTHLQQRIGVIRSISNNLQGDLVAENRGAVRGQIRELQSIRHKIFENKYLMKSLNNFIMNLTPFFLYTIGGFMVLEGQLSLGALVASLASYKDLAPAIRELFNYYQRIHDARLRYDEVLRFVLPHGRVAV